MLDIAVPGGALKIGSGILGGCGLAGGSGMAGIQGPPTALALVVVKLFPGRNRQVQSS